MIFPPCSLLRVSVTLVVSPVLKKPSFHPRLPVSDVLFTCGHIGCFDSQFPVHLAEEWPDGKLGGYSCAPCRNTEWLQHAGLYIKFLSCSLKIISHSVSTHLCCIWGAAESGCAFYVLFCSCAFFFFLVVYHLCF